MKKLLFPLAAALIVSGGIASLASAQEWPQRTIRIVVSFGPGGGADIIGRILADSMQSKLGQPVIVENKPGAGGNLAAAAAAHAAPDGTTLFLATTGTHASNVSLYKNLPFDPAKDFAPLTLVTLNPQAIVAGAKYDNLDLKGLIDKLKAAGAAANFGSSGIGSATHLAGDLFNRETGAALVHVPYRGQGPALNDLLGGRLDVMFPLAADVFSFVKSGKLTAFAMMSERRAKALPDVPTTAELGLPKLRLSPIWTALYTVAGTPAPIVERLNRELVRIIAAPAFAARLEVAGYEVHASSPAELRDFAAAETARWGEIIRTLDVHLE